MFDITQTDDLLHNKGVAPVWTHFPIMPQENLALWYGVAETLLTANVIISVELQKILLSAKCSFSND